MRMIRLFGAFKCTSTNLLYRSNSYIMSEKEQRLSIYRSKSDYVEEASEMFKLFKENVEEEHFNTYFCLACRHLSRILRKSKKYQGSTISQFLGTDMMNLRNLKVEQMSFQEISDTINFLSYAYYKFAFYNENYDQTMVMIDNILNECLKKIKAGFQKRSLSYLLKSTRCAQLFKSQYYRDFLGFLIKIDDSNYSFFDLLSLINTIFRSSSKSSSIIENQTILLEKMLGMMIEKETINEISNDDFMDFLTPLLQIHSHYPAITENMTYFQQFMEEYQKNIQENYKNLLGEQIIRYQKIMSKYNNKNKLYNKLNEIVFKSIDQKGEASLNPYFIFMFICNAIEKEAFVLACPDWETRFMNFLKFYTFQKKAKSFSFLQKKLFPYLLQSHALNEQNNIQVLRMKNIFLLEICKVPNNQHLHYYNSLEDINHNLNYFQFQRVKQLVKFLFQQRNNMKRSTEFFLYVIVFELKNFLRLLGIKVNIDDWHNFLPRKSVFGANNKNLYSNLISLYKQNPLYEKSAKYLTNNNVFGVNNLVRTLAITFRYEEMLKNLLISSPTYSLYTLYFEAFSFLPIPLHLHKTIKKFFVKGLYSLTNACQLLLQEVGAPLHIDRRSSYPQAMLMYQFLQSLPPKELFHNLTQHFIRDFLLTYTPDTYLSLFFDLCGKEALPPEQYEITLINICYFFENHVEIEKFTSIIERTLQQPITNPQIHKNLIQLCLRNHIKVSREVLTKWETILKDDLPLQVKEIINANNQKVTKDNVMLLFHYLPTLQTQKFIKELPLNDVIALCTTTQSYTPQLLDHILSHKDIGDVKLQPLLRLAHRIKKQPLLNKQKYHLIQLLVKECRTGPSNLVLETIMLAESMNWYHPELLTLSLDALQYVKGWKYCIDGIKLYESIANYPKSKEQASRALSVGMPAYKLEPYLLYVPMMKLLGMGEPKPALSAYFSYLQEKIDLPLPNHIKNIHKLKGEKQAFNSTKEKTRQHVIRVQINPSWGKHFQQYHPNNTHSRILNQDMLLMEQIITMNSGKTVEFYDVQ